MFHFSFIHKIFLISSTFFCRLVISFNPPVFHVIIFFAPVILRFYSYDLYFQISTCPQLYMCRPKSHYYTYIYTFQTEPHIACCKIIQYSHWIYKLRPKDMCRPKCHYQPCTLFRLKILFFSWVYKIYIWLQFKATLHGQKVLIRATLILGRNY